MFMARENNFPDSLQRSDMFSPRLARDFGGFDDAGDDAVARHSGGVTCLWPGRIIIRLRAETFEQTGAGLRRV